MDEVSEIQKAIEIKRSELNQAGDKYGHCSDLVLRKSQELDDLLNVYNKKFVKNRAAE
ncbi:hypothetical protein M2277_005658 [Paenibacillus sp. LBL]|uniref:aspartyl-phosphate phosphatase Spo0E family protein n=1 Tax=Paenibacillus sp. LBL TaxID=2940563 RepID=UPI002476DFEF|nr:aspartyl-phosphate phosphatase Spo0E family protein [Paenibacillus sp. LBL]MDH6674959.1 hypothetical protein [Paenibacillus sp. LBL]